ncbi:MAG: hypothetical protein KDJ31_18735 [Candidatus Competibacteraceae bacterium]|nr:hypothetical protein [Candidatus Competibacteraceae bacterium]MCB1822580.1 hypothetical protein [Candidatus Competibacteraceae bacterium]
MTRQEYAQFTLYDAETAIPRYQRAWVWGTAALAILCCGAAAGWLLGGLLAAHSPVGADRWAVDKAALLVQQKAANEQLRERIAGLEQALAGDVCAPSVLKALTSDVGDR